MAAISQARKQEIAQELRVAATWVGGPRQTKLLALAAEIAGESFEDPSSPDTATAEGQSY